jgi:hypothetical protein
MSWYSAMIIYESDVEGPPDPSPIREESIRVLCAESEKQAWKKAEQVGRQNEHSYKNERGELVSWKFRRVVEVQDLCEEELTDGVEVFSRMTMAP